MFQESSEEVENFERWNGVKTELHLYGRKPKISQGQIWWAGVGKNIGNEINGKNERFSRPILVYKKIASDKFMAIPLTSKEHTGSWYVPFMQGGKKQIAVVGEARMMNVKRLYRMIGEIDDSDYKRIQEGFLKLFI